MEVFYISIKDKSNLINEEIRAAEVMLIGPNGEQLGVKSRKDALTLANYAGFDLVLMSEGNKVPVCKIMDYNKFRYEKQKKLKESQKKQKESNLELKEFRLSATIDVHDFNTKLNNATKYIEKGHKIKVAIRFKGRQIAHANLGRDVMMKFFNALEEKAVIETEPKLEGKNMFMILAPKSK